MHSSDVVLKLLFLHRALCNLERKIYNLLQCTSFHQLNKMLGYNKFGHVILSLSLHLSCYYSDSNTHQLFRKLYAYTTYTIQMYWLLHTPGHHIFGFPISTNSVHPQKFSIICQPFTMPLKSSIGDVMVLGDYLAEISLNWTSISSNTLKLSLKPTNDNPQHHRPIK